MKMNDEQHTPGPWKWRATLGPSSAEHLKGPCVIETGDGSVIAVLNGWCDAQQEADAQLIATEEDQQ